MRSMQIYASGASYNLGSGLRQNDDMGGVNPR